MGSLSDYSENELLDHVFNAAYSPVSTVYLALSTADPLDTGAGIAEPSGNGYIRKAITFAAAASRQIVQNAQVNFDQASASWGTITHYAVFDAESNGNMLGHGQLTASKLVNSGNTPSVANGEAIISFSAGEISDYLAHKLLDLMFRNQAYSVPDTYVALCTAAVADDSTGSSITEPSGNNYARKQVNPNGGSTPVWTVASGGALENSDIVTFNVPSGTWGLITAMAIADALTAGNILFYDNDVPEDTPGDGDTVRFAAGALDVSMT